MDKLSLGFEAAKYKASIKSSPVVSNNVYQSLLASEFHCPEYSDNGHDNPYYKEDFLVQILHFFPITL